MKVIFHIDEAFKWPIVLDNCKNVLTYGKENNINYEIEVVVNGVAILNFIEVFANPSDKYNKMIALNEDGVVFVGCHNALHKFNPADLPLCSFVKVVPAAMIEITNRQEEGYHYIKP